MTTIKTLYGIIFFVIWGGCGVDNRPSRSYDGLVSINHGAVSPPLT